MCSDNSNFTLSEVSLECHFLIRSRDLVVFSCMAEASSDPAASLSRTLCHFSQKVMHHIILREGFKRRFRTRVQNFNIVLERCSQLLKRPDALDHAKDLPVWKGVDGDRSLIGQRSLAVSSVSCCDSASV